MKTNEKITLMAKKRIYTSPSCESAIVNPYTTVLRTSPGMPPGPDIDNGEGD